MNEISELRLPTLFEPWYWVKVEPLPDTLPGLAYVMVPLYITTEES